MFWYIMVLPRNTNVKPKKQKMKTQSINKTLQDAFRGDLERRLSVPWEHLEAFVFCRKGRCSMGNNCLRCVKWDDGKGLEVIYQAGIKPAMLHAESILKTTKDLIDIRQICLIVNYLREMDEALTGFQGELGLIDKSEDSESTDEI